MRIIVLIITKTGFTDVAVHKGLLHKVKSKLEKNAGTFEVTEGLLTCSISS